MNTGNILYEYHPACLLLPKMADDEYAALRASIKAGYDAKHPIILFGGKILDGRHRYEAAKEEGITAVFHTVPPEINPFDYVRREHSARRSWKNQEQKALVIGELLEKSAEYQTEMRKIRDEANRARAEAAREQHKTSRPWAGEKMVPPQSEAKPSSKTTSRNYSTEQQNKSTAAKAVMLEVSRPAVERAEFIKRNAPDLAGKVASGEITAASAIREIKRTEIVARLEDTAAKEAKALEGVYDVIVIDPPWPMQKIERDVRSCQAEFDYPTMQEAELAAMQLPAADSCHLWLWTTHKFLPMAFRCLGYWEFKYVCMFVWHKPGGFQPFGLPQYNCEFALYARRGTPEFVDTKAFPVCFDAARGAHSEKPDEFYDLVRRVTAGRRVDIFNRRQIEGFDGWGNEANERRNPS